MNIILWELSLKRQSTLQALSTPTSLFQEPLASPRRARTCSHCHLRNFLRFLGARGRFADQETLRWTSPGVRKMQIEAKHHHLKPINQVKTKPSHTLLLEMLEGAAWPACWLLPLALVHPTEEPLCPGSPSPPPLSLDLLYLPSSAPATSLPPHRDTVSGIPSPRLASTWHVVPT